MTRLGAFHRIGPEAVPELLERDDILVFDVRDLRSYDEGRIAGAGHLTVVTLDAVLQSTPKAPPRSPFSSASSAPRTSTVQLVPPPPGRFCATAL